jgi:5-formyltetrahydrofolate cyclo-ligase
MDELPKVAEVESASVPASFLLSEPKFTFELNSLAARQDLLTLAAQQLSFEHENGANLRQQRQRPPKIEALPIVNKDIVRSFVWEQLDSANLVRFPRPCKGCIPNFQGHSRAANRLSKCKEYLEARTVKVNGSLAQEKVRYLSLWDRKVLLVPAGLQDGFMWEIDGNDITDKKCKLAANKRGLKQYGTERRLRELKGKHFDLVVVGSVAVCPRTGARLGKGNGFNDLEWGILCELGVVDERTKVATTVHDVQVLDLPHFLCQPHDLPVDIICTPARTIRVRNRRPRPSGVNWSTLSPELSDLAPLRDLRRFQRLREKRKELKSGLANGSSSEPETNHSSITTAGSTTTTTTTKEQRVDEYLTTMVDALCKPMAELNHDVDAQLNAQLNKNQLRV